MAIMGLSIFYAISLSGSHTAEQVNERLSSVAEEARTLAKKMQLKVGISKIRTLSGPDCAMAQAKMSEDFDFARTACRPPGLRSSSPLGELPEAAMFFRISVQSDRGVNIGLARYRPEADFKMLIGAGGEETQYDGRWFYWTFVDVFSEDESKLLEDVLQKAKGLGFETTFKNEALG